MDSSSKAVRMMAFTSPTRWHWKGTLDGAVCSLSPHECNFGCVFVSDKWTLCHLVYAECILVSYNSISACFRSCMLCLDEFNFVRRNIAKIHSNRKRSVAIHAGLVARDQDGIRMSDPGGSLMGQAVAGPGPTPGRSLSSILDEMNLTTVDFWSLDVEGAEIQVLEGLVFLRV